jgi:hypothetical protein
MKRSQIILIILVANILPAIFAFIGLFAHFVPAIVSNNCLTGYIVGWIFQIVLAILVAIKAFLESR